MYECELSFFNLAEDYILVLCHISLDGTKCIIKQLINIDGRVIYSFYFSMRCTHTEFQCSLGGKKSSGESNILIVVWLMFMANFQGTRGNESPI